MGPKVDQKWSQKGARNGPGNGPQSGPNPVPDWSQTNTVDVLAEAGIGVEEIEAMRDEGIVA